MITVGGKQMPYGEVTSTILNTMMQSEREEYIRIGRQVYTELVFD
ncbi:unnamed protein product [Protopolystoma xenopodis]|uniref:Transcription factor TFIIE alpha subunit C-terminal domain-containing protein n=1 Tax=Protopolystoma xenopodis TaxID=117903 RepID=A0A3S5AS49_9PLAT|nr:unnamed protein product [Protopolystoma xenopodis]